jgi:dolichol kinase
VLFLCAGVFLILLVTYLKKAMPSVHKTERVSFGSILFPIPIYFCFLAATRFDNDLLFYLPISLMTISDTLAEWGGKKWQKTSMSFFNGQKTLAGSLSFAVSSFVISLLIFAVFGNLSLQQQWLSSLIIMLIATVTELLTLKGFDNLSVPFVTLVILYVLS